MFVFACTCICMQSQFSKQFVDLTIATTSWTIWESWILSTVLLLALETPHSCQHVLLFLLISDDRRGWNFHPKSPTCHTQTSIVLGGERVSPDCSWHFNDAKATLPQPNHRWRKVNWKIWSSYKATKKAMNWLFSLRKRKSGHLSFQSCSRWPILSWWAWLWTRLTSEFNVGVEPKNRGF